MNVYKVVTSHLGFGCKNVLAEGVYGAATAVQSLWNNEQANNAGVGYTGNMEITSISLLAKIDNYQRQSKD